MASHRPTPLRYPGGKSAILPLVEQIIAANNLQASSYAEPYAGGAGLALRLLYEGLVSDLYLNDIDRGIFAFWTLVLEDTEDLLRRISEVDVSIDEWFRQQDVLKSADPDPKDLGFATFFMNRTNRSGIITGAGPIGGFKQQGNYPLDCRFNRRGLSEKIERIASYAGCIHLSDLDAEVFMRTLSRREGETILFCIDPPYFNKGSSLYTSFYRPEDHAYVAETVRNLRDPWIVTYDNTPEIHALYADQQRFNFDIKYSVQTKRIGNEVLIAKDGLTIPEIKRFNLKAA